MANLELSQLKLQFNNDIIKLKKCFLQSRLQTINKLSKKSKALKSKKYPDELKEKFNKKSEAVVSEINILKKVELQEVVRFGVQNLENLIKFIDTPEVDKKKAYSRICIHKSLQPKLQILVKKFSMVPIEKLTEVNPIKVNKKKRKEKIKQKLKNAATTEKLLPSENGDNEEIEPEKSAPYLNINSKKTDEIKNVVEKEDRSKIDDGKVKIVKEKVNNKSENVKTLTTKDGKKSEEVKNVAEKQDKPKICTDESENESENEDQSVSNDSENEDKPVLNDSESGFSEDDNQMQISDHEEIQPKPKEITNEKSNKKKRTIKMLCDANTIDDAEIEKNVDPFFVTESGSTYLTLASQRPPDKLVNDQSNNRRVRRAAMFGYEAPQRKQKPQLAKPKFDRKQLIDSANEEALHPSWAAKKQKSQIAQFQGKKVSFDRESNDILESKSKSDEKLHPSWEAKKQKKNPVAFEGKKIVFDE